MPRDVVHWLRCAADFIDSLPDHESTMWRRELLHVLALYCSAYSCFVGITRTISEWSRLCRLCAEVQQSAGTERSDDDPIVRAQFYALCGYHLALAANVRTPVDLDEVAATSSRLSGIAHTSGDYLMIAHAQYVEAIEHIHHGRYDQTVRTSLRAWQLCVPYYRPDHAYTVNPLAPIDPGLGALMCAANALTLLGRLSEAADYADRCVTQASLNEESITYQWALGMRGFIFSQLGELHTVSSVDRFAAYFQCTRSSEQGPTSTLYETCYDLHRAVRGGEVDAAAVRQSAERQWQHFQDGDSFIIAFSSPLCELLHRAGMWSEGLQLTDQWRYLSRRGQLAFYYPDCHRFKAMFLLQKAQQQRSDQQLRGRGGQHNEQRQIEQANEYNFSLSPLFSPTAPITDGWPTSPAPIQLDMTEETSGTTAPSSAVADVTLTMAAVDIYEEAVNELKEAVSIAASTQARLLELKALIEIVPLLQQLTQLELGVQTAAASNDNSEAGFQSRLRQNMHEAEQRVHQRRLRQLLTECTKDHETYSVIQRAQQVLATCLST